MLYFIVTLVFILALEYFHSSERKQLLNRIMAKDYTEYKALEEKPKKSKVKEEKPLDFI